MPGLAGNIMLDWTFNKNGYEIMNNSTQVYETEGNGISWLPKQARTLLNKAASYNLFLEAWGNHNWAEGWCRVHC